MSNLENVITNSFDWENFECLSLCKERGTHTYHIFCAKKINKKCEVTVKHPVCNNKNIKYKEGTFICKAECLNVKLMRIKCAELANGKKQICGNCVKRLYDNQHIKIC
jgi:hypothetical protein